MRHRERLTDLKIVINFIMETTYVRAGDVRKNYNISVSTLANWANQGKIRFIRPGRNRYYHKEDIIALCGQRSHNQQQGTTICYARVSTNQQQEDLDHQCNNLKAQFPDAEIISDIGSGLDWNREGFRKLLELIYEENITRVVVEYKDRLCRFGFELFQWICEKRGVELMVLNCSTATDKYSSGELSEDLLAIINHSAARNNARKQTKTQRRKRQYKRKLADVNSSDCIDKELIGSAAMNPDTRSLMEHKDGTDENGAFSETPVHSTVTQEP